MRYAAATALAAAGLTVAATGCGGSSANHVAQLGSTTTQAASTAGSRASTPQNGAFARAIAYAQCMRTNGITNWPDPMNSSGVFDKSKLGLQQLGVSASRLQSSQTACRHLLPNGGRPPNQAQRAQEAAQALSFSRCIRAHGVPNFPDPDSTGRIPDPATVGINQGAPKFEAANQACGKYRPPYMPSNSAYNAYARTHGGGNG